MLDGNSKCIYLIDFNLLKTTSDWYNTLILFILLLETFSQNKKKKKKNYCDAARLLWGLIFLALCLAVLSSWVDVGII